MTDRTPVFTFEEIAAAYKAQQHVAAIKMLRAETGCGLSEAVEALRDGKLESMEAFKEMRTRRKAERNGAQLFALAKRIAALNGDAGTIGPGMLANLVGTARAIVSEIEKE